MPVIKNGNHDSSNIPGEDVDEETRNIYFDSEQLDMSLFDEGSNRIPTPSVKEADEAAARQESARTAYLGKQRLFAATHDHGIKDVSAILREQGIGRKRAGGLTINQAIKQKPKKKRYHPPPAPATESQKIKKARLIASRNRAKARTAARNK